MRRTNSRQHPRAPAVIAVLVTLAVPVDAVGPRADDGQIAGQKRADIRDVTGMTAPFREAVLASVQPARIASILAEEGALVRESDLIIALDEGIQAARTQIAKASAESSLNIELARSRWVHAKRDLDRLVKLDGNDFASSKELSDALAKAEIAHIEYEIANFTQSQASRAYERERRILEEYRLRAPFDAYVAEHLKHRGETVDQLEGILRLVQLDPLIVTVDCPLAQMPPIAAGDRFRVRPVDERWRARMGEVLLASRIADGASQTFKVKLSVGNADLGWIAGMKVVVEFKDGANTGKRTAVVNESLPDSRDTAKRKLAPGT